MKTINGDAWVISGLGCVTADFLQGNDLLELQLCKECMFQPTDRRPSCKNWKSTFKNGQKTASYQIWYNKTRFFQYAQVKLTPPNSKDTYHSMFRKARILLEAIFNIFSMGARTNFWYIEKTIEAKILKLAFLIIMTENIYQELQKSLKEEHELLIQALQHLINGWTDFRFNAKTNALNNLNMDLKLYTILSGWYVTESPNTTFTNIQNDEGESDVRSKNPSKKLDENYPYFRDIYRAYADYLNSRAAILNNSLTFYNSITYIIFKSNQEPV
ncbi:hypothetical protein C1645_817803 [Glomus cerebriforme]|uniref:Uncharacterized protein n=1 Tax=Glomus cerebriforme TaxID=658196 RepID=A0A397TI82_9GLOM|nr:hypothetical protein C1645_817803 [Glomus cerebriforme]